MRYVEDKGCYNNNGPTQETPNSSAMYSEFHKGKDATRVSNHHHRATMGKPTPSKWDDAQKWLVGLSKGGEKSHSKSKPRNSNADDLRLIAPVPQKEHDYSSSEKEEEENDACHDFMTNIISANAIAAQYEAEAKRVECDESNWGSNNNNNDNRFSGNTIQVQPICFRDMGTEMTPITSQEPSRTGTPIRATTPATRSPIHSGTSTPMRGQNGLQQVAEGGHGTTRKCGDQGSTSPCKKTHEDHQARKLSPLESRAMAWDEAERAKFMARFKREEVKIQAWENHQIRKAEMEMKKMEVPSLLALFLFLQSSILLLLRCYEIGTPKSSLA
ncbi:Remorin 4.1 isoform F [Glycine soja]|uniref:Remorin 4.1 isoform D n=1 Tax=Glycine soja TaxID=3848 RepID=A0A445KNX2_GLYSO|nr:Remorin 4.1 isoform D [Glycine soja]RZC12462.1 Remorin 4.1 isoform E [Glycine soja]RZC12463.1 Remorin 4.1 isoform F [Glycine soja]